MSNLASSKYPVVTATTSEYQWYWQEQPLSIAYETVGIGEPILLLYSKWLRYGLLQKIEN
ncbi:MAG: hypothetical protein LH613_03760 [Chamaesiphon sp.]|nr:hypothetical protein [Chamaesiphon sp.]